MREKYNYIITTGWWSTNDDSINDRRFKRGDSLIRTDEFHKEWFKAIDTFTHPEKIYIIDSDSPVKPIIDEKKEVVISLQNNAGHATQHTGKLSGVSRAHLLGMSVAMANEADYWVYVEQDALIYGEDIVEECIRQMKKPYMFGAGKGTPQPVQHSLMIIKKEAIPEFIRNFNSINARDSEISPEMKFAIATSLPLRLIPEWMYKKMKSDTLLGELCKRLIWKCFQIFQGFDDVPFGYGRARPIDFDATHFYFQHGEKEELEIYLRKMQDR